MSNGVAVSLDVPTAGPSNPVKALEGYLDALNRAIRQLLLGFEEQRVSQGRRSPLSQSEVEAATDDILSKLPVYESAQDVVRTALEKSLESAILNLPALCATPWQDEDSHVLLYHDMLDILVTVTNRQLIDANAAMQTLEYLLEAQTVQKAEQLFAYLETRREVLTKDMVLGRGKALTILRTLNDLLRRSSKATHTVFCGRIRLFLANTFPLGERSGVNLRGDFNKENVTTFEYEEPVDEIPAKSEIGDEDDQMVEDSLLPKVKDEAKDEPTTEAPEDGEEVEDKMSVDDATGAAEKKDSPVSEADKNRSAGEPDFYTLFWSLQRYFSDPPSLFNQTVSVELPSSLAKYAAGFPKVPPLGKDGKVIAVPLAAGSPNLTLLRQGMTKMLDVFADASKREKALQGAARESGKRRGDNAPKSASLLPSEEDVRKLFFYPKYLTSKSLIDLEAADGNFRRQAMVQGLILCQFLHSCTDAARTKISSTLKHPNRTLQQPPRLADSDNLWVSDLEARTYMEISRTPPDGEYFVKTIRTALQGERNWSLWKEETCPQFEKLPVTADASQAGKANVKKLQQLPANFVHKAGTAALSRLWQNASKKMEDIAKPDTERTLHIYFDAARMQAQLISERKQELIDEGRSDEQQQASDGDMQRLEERKAAIAWRALRLASGTHLQSYGRIGVNNIEKLLEEIDKPPPTMPHLAPATPVDAKATTPGDVERTKESATVPTKDAEQPSGDSEQAPAATISQTLHDVPDVKIQAAPDVEDGQPAEGEHNGIFSGGKRSRETSEMHVEDSVATSEQFKKQKVDSDSAEAQ